MKQEEKTPEIPPQNTVPEIQPAITSEAAQEAHEAALADFNTERKGNVRTSLNAIPLTAEQKQMLNIQD